MFFSSRRCQVSKITHSFQNNNTHYYYHNNAILCVLSFRWRVNGRLRNENEPHACALNNVCRFTSRRHAFISARLAGLPFLHRVVSHLIIHQLLCKTEKIRESFFVDKKWWLGCYFFLYCSINWELIDLFLLCMWADVFTCRAMSNRVFLSIIMKQLKWLMTI